MPTLYVKPLQHQRCFIALVINIICTAIATPLLLHCTRIIIALLHSYFIICFIALSIFICFIAPVLPSTVQQMFFMFWQNKYSYLDICSNVDWMGLEHLMMLITASEKHVAPQISLWYHYVIIMIYYYSVDSYQRIPQSSILNWTYWYWVLTWVTYCFSDDHVPSHQTNPYHPY